MKNLIKTDGTIIQEDDTDKSSQIWKVLKKYPNVNGFKIRDKDIDVYVAKKLGLTALDADDIVPEKIEGFKTNIIPVGEVKADYLRVPYDAEGLKDKWRPVPANVSIGNKLITAGTCGGICTDNQTNLLGFATNTHVGCANVRNDLKDQPSLEVVQPGVYHGGVYPEDKIGRVTKAFIMPAGKTAYNDFAFVERECDELVAKYSALMKEITGYELPVGLDTLQVGDKIFTISAMLEYRDGTVISIGDSFNIGYGDDGNVLHAYCISTTPISIGGSSGSWVYKMTDVGPKLVAYLFAGSTERTICHEIQNALNAADLTPVFMEPGNPSPMYSVSGTVVDDSSALPIVNVPVTITYDTKTETVIGDINGTFTKSIDGAGLINIWIDIPGYDKYENTCNVTVDNKDVNLGIIRIKKKQLEEDKPKTVVFDSVWLDLGFCKCPITGYGTII